MTNRPARGIVSGRKFRMKNKRINIKVSELDHQLISNRAAELQLSISEYIRRLVISDVAKSEK